MKKVFFLFFLLPVSLICQEKKEVLFIGNSYTYGNNLPEMLKQIALSFGDTIHARNSGGAT